MPARVELLRLTSNAWEVADLRLREKGETFVFEREGFVKFADGNPELIGLGPRLAEWVLTECGMVFFSKPDGIFFEVQDGDWELRKLVEIKSGGLYGMVKKLYGFREVVHRLREEPGLMRETIRSSLAQQEVRLPERVIIPRDSMIEVDFVSHKLFQPSVSPKGIYFRLNFLRY